MLHSNQGLQSIVDTAYDILQNPVIVVDSSYKILAMYQNPVIAGERDDLEEQRSLGYMLKSNVEAMTKAKLYERARENGYPFYNKDADAKYGWITALVYIHGIEVGQIGVMDSQHPFSDVDFELVDFLCKVVSLELQKSDFYRTNQGLMHSYFLSDLLDNQVHDSSCHRAAYHKPRLEAVPEPACHALKRPCEELFPRQSPAYHPAAASYDA